MITKLKKIVTRIATPLLVVVGIVVATGVPTVAADPLCGPGSSTPCAIVWTNTTPQPDCKIYIRFYNPYGVSVPRNITIYYNGEENYGDVTWVGPGWTPATNQSPLTYNPPFNGEWRVVVASGTTTLVDKEFYFNCGY